MKKLFEIDSPFLDALTRALDILLINILTIVCSAPIVTANAALVAANRVMQDMIYDTDPHYYRTFIRSFQESLKQSILSGVLFAGVSAVLLCDLFWIYRKASGTVGILLYLLLAIMILLAVSVFSHLHLLMARYDNSLRHHLFNAFALSIANPIRTLLVTLLFAAPFLVFFFSPALFFQLIPIILCFYPTSIIFFHNRIIKKTLLQLEQ